MPPQANTAHSTCPALVGGSPRLQSQDGPLGPGLHAQPTPQLIWAPLPLSQEPGANSAKSSAVQRSPVSPRRSCEPAAFAGRQQTSKPVHPPCNVRTEPVAQVGLGFAVEPLTQVPPKSVQARESAPPLDEDAPPLDEDALLLVGEAQPLRVARASTSKALSLEERGGMDPGLGKKRKKPAASARRTTCTMQASVR